ncbi:MAG TPA: hydroxymethylbilane synthase [Anaerolineales bacterium]|nr:hydroxymethylbilane synthase [Anaerolineales bacterium]
MNPPVTFTIRVATRTSPLALRQTEVVLQALQAAWHNLTFSTHNFVTVGDQQLKTPLASMGGKGVFTQELEAALLSNHVDIAVHSLKDLPTRLPDGLTIGAILPRGSVLDALLAIEPHTLHTLPRNAIVGSSSPRRRAQLLAVRPDLRVTNVRGNVGTRIAKLEAGEYDALVLAMAGLERLGHSQYITEMLSLATMLPAPGQGALAVECRANDAQILRLLSAIHDRSTAQAVQAERAFLSGLGGGCAVPVAAYCAVKGDGLLHLTGLVSNADGQIRVRVEGIGQDAPELGRRLALQALSMGGGRMIGEKPPESG